MVLGHEFLWRRRCDDQIRQGRHHTARAFADARGRAHPGGQSVEGDPGDLLANATRRNVRINVDKLKAATPILKSFNDDKKIRVVGGIYQLKSGHVELLT